MGKSKRSMNPADALRKQQRKRELKKNKEDRKRVRESALAKKDVGKVKQDIARLEHLANIGQLDKAGQARLEALRSEARKIEKAKKANELTGAQAAFAARMQEQEKKNEGEARKLVYDPKRGAFVPAKKKDTKGSSSKTDDPNSGSSSDSDSSGSSSSDDSSSDSDDSDDSVDMETDEKEIPLPDEPKQKKVLTESDDEYEIPLPPGPPPHRPFDEQLIPIQAAQQHIRAPPPPPPGPPPFRAYNAPRMPPPPPPPLPYGFRPPQAMAPPVMQYQTQPLPPPPPPPTATAATAAATAFSAPVHYSNAAASTSSTPSAIMAQPVISAEPQLRDLEKEVLGFVPAALRRKQAANKKAKEQ